MPLPTDPSGLQRTEPEARVVESLGELAELKRIVAAQRDEIARLKGLKGRPSVKPSGMENATEPKPGGKRAERRGRGKVTPRVAPETKMLRVAVLRGSQFKGYEPYQVQDLVLTARVMRYRRERWLTPMARRSWRRELSGLDRCAWERERIRYQILESLSPKPTPTVELSPKIYSE